MQNLKVEYVKIDEIKPYKNNAKLHPQEQIEQIKKSIQEFGMNDPVGIWKDEIVEGHGRLLACKELEYTEIPVIRLDHLTDEQRKAYILAHNKLTMNSDFNLDILNSELDDIIDIDMSDFGFDLLDDNISYIDDLMNEEFVGKNETDTFAITLYINKKHETEILNFIKENGKEKIIDEIIRMIG